MLLQETADEKNQKNRLHLGGNEFCVLQPPRGP